MKSVLLFALKTWAFSFILIFGLGTFCILPCKSASQPKRQRTADSKDSDEEKATKASNEEEKATAETVLDWSDSSMTILAQVSLATLPRELIVFFASLFPFLEWIHRSPS